MAAELVGGAFLSSMFQVAFDRLASPEVVDYLRGNNISDDLIHELKIVILAVNAVLDDAEGKQITNMNVKTWLDELEAASYEADDLLDEIATDALQSDLEASGYRKSKKSKSSNFISSSISRRSYNQDMKKKMEDILKRFKFFKESINILGLINKSVGEKPSARQPTTSLIEESEVFGRDGDKEAIVNLLLADDHEGRNKVSVIPIIGMGGIGKTTLAQLAYNDHAVEKHFNLKLWVCVSEEFDIIKVTKTVLCAVTESNSHSYDDTNLDLLQTKLKEGLTGKKFLIVLDDVWNEDYNDWQKMRTPFQFGAHGSKIIVTARNKEVADIMGTTPTHFQLEQLKDEDCWQIFQKHAFDKIRDSSSVSQVLEKIGREIVKKCKGLPIAAKTLGGLLRSKEDVSEWERVLKSEIWDFSHKESKILPALLLSYNYLPSHLKRCFAFCSTFPKDYEFYKYELILLWMAENLLPQASINKRVEDVGNEYFNELVSRSFFERTSIGEESWFVMHDLVHDVARFVSRGYCFSFESGNSDGNMMKVRYLAVAPGVSLQRYGAISKAIHLRSFLLLSQYSYPSLPNQMVNNVILKLRCLRILSLSHCRNLEQLSDSIGELKHLRFLDISWTSIKRLPNSVSRLYNLQTLKLSGCDKLIELPEDIYHLINLRHLDISGCDNLKEMPRQIGDLKSLQTLSTFILGEDNGAKIEELRGLSDLHGELCLRNLQNVASATDASEARLMDKNYLQWVHLFWNVNATDDTAQRAHANVMIHQREVLEKLLPHTNLERLSIYGYGGTSFPYWLGDHSFCNIVSIKLKNCRCCNSLPPLGQLPSLKTLEIMGLSEVVTVGAEFKGNIGGSSITKPFPSLEFLSFTWMSAWEEWSSIGVEDGEVFTMLKRLHIIACKKLRHVDWPDSLPCLTELEIEGYGSELALESSLPRTPALHKLSFGVCEKLRLEELPQTVESIRIGGNNGLESLIEAFNKGQTSFLKKLHIRNCCLAVTLIPECLPTTLTELEIMNCKKLEFPMQCSLKNSSIRRVKIGDSCDSLTFFPLDFVPNLVRLTIWNCENLESLGVSSDGDGMLTSLSEIYIDRCPNFVSFPKGGLHAPNLTTLKVEDCKKLKKLPEQMRNLLPFLNSLEIYNCPELESFPEGGLPSNLDTLEVSNCPKLIAQRMNWNLHALQALKKFTIGGECEGGGVELFPEEGLLPSTLSSRYPKFSTS